MAHHKEEYEHVSGMRGSDPELGLGNGSRLTPTQTTMTISPEMFESLYLAPKNQVAGHLRQTFANPSPVGIMGFCVGLTPLSIEFMRWGGSAGNALATTTASIWFGGMLLILAGLGEFLLGNTFPMLVFFGYGSHFLTNATTFIPYYNAVNAFDPTNTNTLTPEFEISYAFYPMAMCLLSFIFLIGSIRTNGLFFIIFVLATIGFGCASGAFFNFSYGNTELGVQLIVATGACFFASAILGWWLLASIIFAVMELPIPGIPVFDLSTVIKAKGSAAKDD